MSKYEARLGKGFTKTFNKVARSENLNVYDKAVLGVIASCGPESFPSYKTLMRWCAISRERVWKSLKSLESKNLITRYKKTDDKKKVFYLVAWLENEELETTSKMIKFSDLTHRDRSVRQSNRMSSPNESTSVRQTNPIKNSHEELLKEKPPEILLGEEWNRGQIEVPSVMRSMPKPSTGNPLMRGRGMTYPNQTAFQPKIQLSQVDRALSDSEINTRRTSMLAQLAAMQAAEAHRSVQKNTG